MTQHSTSQGATVSFVSLHESSPSCACPTCAVRCPLLLPQNLWFDGPTYLEENKGGTHETNATTASFILTPTTASSATCPTPNYNNHAAAAVSFSGVSALLAVAMLTVALQQIITA